MPNILVVDDSAVDRQLFEGLLEKVPEYFVLQAEDGRDAIRKLEEWDVDIIITDLQMPKMNGLELVTEVRIQYPDVPVILSTSYGSEEIANQALDHGAAGYVPKSKVGELLIPTVRDVLNILYADRSYAHLIGRATITKFGFCLNNDPSYFPPLLDLCEKMLMGMSTLDRMERVRVVVAIEQAMYNALYRGNLEVGPTFAIPTGDDKPSLAAAELINARLGDNKYGDRQIDVSLSISPDRLVCVVRDEGPGFTPPSQPSMEQDVGRGLVLMNAFMDEVVFNDTANQVTLTRFWDPPELSEYALRGGAIEIEAHEDGRPKLVYGRLVSQPSGAVIDLLESKLVVGRRDTCHIILPFKEISKHHCQLWWHEDKWHIKDLNSRTGIWINGDRVKHGTLKPGDTLGIGTYEYKIQYGKQPHAASG